MHAAIAMRPCLISISCEDATKIDHKKSVSSGGMKRADGGRLHNLIAAAVCARGSVWVQQRACQRYLSGMLVIRLSGS